MNVRKMFDRVSEIQRSPLPENFADAQLSTAAPDNKDGEY
jgi:hypothetical protein